MKRNEMIETHTTFEAEHERLKKKAKRSCRCDGGNTMCGPCRAEKRLKELECDKPRPLRSHDHVRTVPAHVGPKDVARGVETWLETATQDDRIQLRILLSAVMEEERVRQMGEYKNGGEKR